MASKEIEAKIKQAFSNAVPDVLDSILSMSQEQKGEVIDMTEEIKTNSGGRRIAGIAAAFLLLLAGVLGFNYYHSNYAVATKVALEVNPSVEIKVNQRERVLDVAALNEDGRVLLGDMDFSGRDLDVAVNAIIGSMLRNGYLSDLANSILISVDNDDPVKSGELQERLTQEINSLFATGAFNGAVLSQTISAQQDLRTLADTYGITVGKAQLIREITEKNNLYQFQELVPLSINQLNLLSSSAGTNLDKVTSVGQASDKAYIGREAAKQIAFDHAGVSAANATSVEVDMDWEHGAMVYEVEFKSGGYEFEYDIDAKTGAIYGSERDRNDNDDYDDNHDYKAPGTGTSQSQPPASSSYIGTARAKEIALAHAGVSAGSIRDLDIELEREHGVMVYEVEFESGDYEYEYEIDARTGAIYKSEKDRDDDDDADY